MVNPFHALYASEKVTPDEFVGLFSPNLMAELAPLYRPGNIVLRGMQGSGKTMLLDLLKPEVKVAYHRAGVDFPVSAENRFVGCGINLVKSRAFEFGQRAASRVSDDAIDTGILFGDFVNYWLTLDLLRGLKTLCEAGGSLSKVAGIHCDPGRLDACAREIANSPVWFGYLDGVETFGELENLVETRIATIRSWVNRNLKSLPEEILNSRTSAGEPLSDAVRVLHELQVIEPDVNVLVRIDQYEELHYMSSRISGGRETAEAMQSTIHKMMGVRDARLSYRIGARLFAWPEHPVRLAGQAPLELKRDYDNIDLDSALQHGENSRKSYFADFARDIFRRRLETAGADVSDLAGRELMRQAFGSTPTKHAKAVSYVGTGRKEPTAPKGPWDDEYGEALRKIADADPYVGILAEAWSRSKFEKGTVDLKTLAAGPWKGYWSQDRADQASLQLAASAAQRMRWYGDEDIIRLANANPLVLVTLCKELFDSAERNNSTIGGVLGGRKEPPMPINHQNEAVYEASEAWFSKIAQSEGGRFRQGACIQIGEWAREALRSDRMMSRPGHNGFSIDEMDLRSDEQLENWLREAVDHAALVYSRHTSKNGPARLKFYLAPILCPRFQVPSTRRKEPKYLSAVVVREWLVEGDRAAFNKVKKRPAGKKAQKSDGAIQAATSDNRLFQ